MSRSVHPILAESFRVEVVVARPDREQEAVREWRLVEVQSKMFEQPGEIQNRPFCPDTTDRDMGVLSSREQSCSSECHLAGVTRALSCGVESRNYSKTCENPCVQF